MENEVVIHVRAEDDTGPTFAAINAKAKKLGETTERGLKQSGTKAGAGLADGIDAGLSGQRAAIIAEAGQIGDAVGERLTVAGSEAGRELGETLGEQGERAGEQLAEGIHRGADGKLRDSRGRFAAGLGEQLAGGAARAGKRVAGSLISSIAEELGNAKNPAIAAAIVGALATVAPLIGGVLGAAVIGTGGTLGIVGGFAAASQHPAVKQSSKVLGETLKKDLEKASTDFVPAALAAIGQVRTAWKTILPDIESLFSRSAPLIEPFLDGILDGVAALVAGIEDSLGTAGPVMEGFGDLFRSVGEDLGEIFTDLSDDGPVLADALSVLAGTISVLGDAITWVIEVSAGWLAQFPAFKRDVVELAEGLGILEDETGAVSIKNAEWHDSAIDAANAVDRQIEGLQTLADEMRKQTDPLYGLLTAQQDVTSAQEAYNKALDKHGPKSDEAQDALVKLGKAANRVTDAAANAAKNGLDVVTPAMRNAWRQAGLTEKEMRALESALRGARNASNSWADTYTAVYVTEYKTKGLKSPSPVYAGYAHGGIKGAANGATSSGLTMVGEHGPELVDLPAGTRVHSAPDSQRLLTREAAASTSGNPSTVMFRFDPSGASKLIKAIMEGLRAEIRDDGGSVQKTLGVTGVG